MPSLMDGEILLADARGTIYALHPDSGSTSWSLASSGAATEAIFVGPDAFFLAATTGVVVAYDRDSRSVRWVVPAGGTPTTAPLLFFDDTLVVARDDRTLVALEVEDGKVRWQRPTSSVVQHLAGAGNLVVTGTEGGEVALLDLEDGEILWEAVVSGPVSARPLVTEDAIIVSTGAGDVILYRTR
jgi:outer membrane protein assembly factor BamB